MRGFPRIRNSGLSDELWVLDRLSKSACGWVRARRLNSAGPARTVLRQGGYIEEFGAPDGRGRAYRITPRGQAYLLRRLGS